MQTHNIIITSISNKAPMVEAIKKASTKLYRTLAVGKLNPKIDIPKIYGGDSDENCICKYLPIIDEFWHMKKDKDLKIEDIIDYCKENKITMIIPSRDKELDFYSNYRSLLFKNGINVMVSSFATINKCNDKLLFYETMKKLQYLTPFTTTDCFSIRDYSIENNINSFVVKERYGAGADNILLNVGLDSICNFHNKFKDPIYQPFIKGTEISVDCYIDKKGKCKGIVSRTRDSIINGESQITTSFYDKKIEIIFSDLAEKLKIRGHAVFQAIIDKKGQVYTLEVNPRIGGASTLSIQIGLDSFFWFMLESLDKKLDKYCHFPIKQKAIKMVRYKKDMFCIKEIKIDI